MQSEKPTSITDLTEYLKRKRFPSKDRLSMATVRILDVVSIKKTLLVNNTNRIVEIRQMSVSYHQSVK